MKKALGLTLLLAATVFVPKAFALTITDITEDFWAKNEIVEMVQDKIMNVNEDGKFNPENSVERAEFTSMLIKVLSQSDLDVYIENPFEDVSVKTEYYDDIMRSEQIGLVYGYPDGTFKPKKDINKAEVTSVVSHITKDTILDLSILENFTDISLIPDWAKQAYAKTVKYNLFVNHPDRLQFEPNRDITRAETAVLLAKLKAALTNVKEEYKAEEIEKALSVEHLSVNSYADSNVVTITNMRKIIAEGNILKVSFLEKYNSKKANNGEEVIFTNAKDVVTDEGTLVIPQGAKFYATAEEIVAPKYFNKPAQVKFKFNKLELPSGEIADMNAIVFNKNDGYLKDSSKAKIAAWTAGGLVVGTGAGSAIGFPTDEIGASYAIGIPTGAVLGLAGGLVSKGVNFKAEQGEEVYIKLNQDLSITDSL